MEKLKQFIEKFKNAGKENGVLYTSLKLYTQLLSLCWALFKTVRGFASNIVLYSVICSAVCIIVVVSCSSWLLYKRYKG